MITLLISHLAETHSRAGFFSIRVEHRDGKAGELAVFKLEPAAGPLSTAALAADRASTLQDVVGTRACPTAARCSTTRAASFLTTVLGACPPEILLVPVTVRERVRRSACSASRPACATHVRRSSQASRHARRRHGARADRLKKRS